MGTGTLSVAAGVDTHKDVHVLCVIDALGRKVREGAFPATPNGYRDLADAIGGREAAWSSASRGHARSAPA